MGSLEGVYFELLQWFYIFVLFNFFQNFTCGFKFSLQLPDILNYEYISKKVRCKTHRRNKESDNNMYIECICLVYIYIDTCVLAGLWFAIRGGGPWASLSDATLWKWWGWVWCLDKIFLILLGSVQLKYMNILVFFHNLLNILLVWKFQDIVKNVHVVIFKWKTQIIYSM